MVLDILGDMEELERQVKVLGQQVREYEHSITWSLPKYVADRLLREIGGQDASNES